MYERFGGESRRVVAASQQEARILRHVVVTSEHLVLALLQPQPGSLAAPVLAAMGVTLDAARGQLGQQPGGVEARRGTDDRQQLPFTASARLILDLARHEALDHDSDLVLPEHLLLALLDQRDSPGVELLRALGVDPDQLRLELLRRLADAYDTPDTGCGPPVEIGPPLPPLFAASGRRIMAAATTAAMRLGHRHLGTEHLLLGLLSEADDEIRHLLHDGGLTAEEVVCRVRTMLGAEWTTTSGEVPWTPRARQVLDRSLAAATVDGVRAIGARHVLVGLLGEERGVAANLLGGPDGLRALRERAQRLPDGEPAQVALSDA